MTLPPVLCLQLLRFVYDASTNTKKKVSDPIRFPEVLDITPYTRDGAAAAATAAAATTDGAAAAAPASGRYRLTAILMHTGASAHSGHYTARIMEQPPGEGPRPGEDGAEGGGGGAEGGGGGAGGASPDGLHGCASTTPHPPGGGAAALLDTARWWNFNDESVVLEGWRSEKQAKTAGVALVGRGGGGGDGGGGGGSGAKARGGGARGRAGGSNKRARTVAASAAPAGDGNGDGDGAGDGDGDSDGDGDGDGSGSGEGDGGAEGGRMFVSRTAYMLNYTLESTLLAELESRLLQEAEAPAAPLQAPAALRASIDADGAALEAEIRQYAAKKEEQDDDRVQREELQSQLLPALEGGATSMVQGDGRWVGEESLEACLSQPPRLGGAIDLAPLQCAHGKACPHKVGRMRLITSGAWSTLVDAFGVAGGGNEGLAEGGCVTCVEHMRDASQQQAEAAAAMQQLGAALARPAPEGSGGGSYLVPKLLAKRAPKLAADGVTDVTAELVCEHGGLAAGRDTRRVDAETWALVQRVFPQSAALEAAVYAAACGECASSQHENKVQRDLAANETKGQRTALARLLRADDEMQSLSIEAVRGSHPPPAAGAAAGGPPQLYVVASSWLRSWRGRGGLALAGAAAAGAGDAGAGAGAGATGTVGGPPGAAASLLCEHGKLTVDPQLCRSWRGLAQPHGGLTLGAAAAASPSERAVDEKLGAEVRLPAAPQTPNPTLTLALALTLALTRCAS